MNWQYVILTISITLITSSLSIVGSLIINKHNYKIAIEQRKQESVREIMNKRIECYKKLLICLSYIDGNLKEENAIENSNILEFYVEREIYISDNVHHFLSRLIKNFDTNKPNEMHFKVINLKKAIKNEINAYLGIPNSIHDKNYPKSK